jgi:D-glycero-beta-D-manno-heptose 1-phosphate adenylyltransferase
MSKVITLDEAHLHRSALHADGKELVLTNGHFDLLHFGHVRYLQAARALGDALFVGLNSDRSTRALKGNNRPLTPQGERAEVLAALECVEAVIIFDELDAIRLVETLRPEIYAKGGDWSASEEPSSGKPLPEAAAVQAYGGRIVLLPYLPEHSTSALIERIVTTFSGR